MNWVVFTYLLPSGNSSSPRVTLWRRLRRLGAIAPTGSAHILPAQDEAVEAFQWLAQELRHAHGEALVMHVTSFEGLSDQQLIKLFQDARTHDYEEIEKQAVELEQKLGVMPQTKLQVLHEAFARLRRRYSEVRRIDYFDAPAGTRVTVKLAVLQGALTPATNDTSTITPVTIAQYIDKQWVTRPRPHVDRLACIWVIRRFINQRAIIRYSLTPAAAEIAFDMHEGGDFGHHGNLCTFETMLAAFGLQEPALQAIAEIVHEIDVRDGTYTRPEIVGIEAVLTGWQHEKLSDTELEARGIALFGGLYTALTAAG